MFCLFHLKVVHRSRGWVARNKGEGAGGENRPDGALTVFTLSVPRRHERLVTTTNSSRALSPAALSCGAGSGMPLARWFQSGRDRDSCAWASQQCVSQLHASSRRSARAKAIRSIAFRCFLPVTRLGKWRRQGPGLDPPFPPRAALGSELRSCVGRADDGRAVDLSHMSRVQLQKRLCHIPTASGRLMGSGLCMRLRGWGPGTSGRAAAPPALPIEGRELEKKMVVCVLAPPEEA